MIIDPYSWHRLSIRSITKVSSDTVSVLLQRPADYQFRAGQYAVVRVSVEGRQLMRQYSFTSAPDDETLELLIQREPDGAVSSWFCDNAIAGDTIEISQPFGGFTWPDNDKPLLFIAGRVGIAPFISMLKHHERVNTPREIAILYSVREPEQLCYRELIEKHRSLFFLTNHGDRLTQDALRQHLTPETVVYICGSKRFVDGITRELSELGVNEARIKRELFTLQ